MALFRNHDEERQARVEKMISDHRVVSHRANEPDVRPRTDTRVKATLEGKRQPTGKTRRRLKR